ncbi:hypothetical protein P4B35_01880 [Pontiellaceae bacterium B12227]|nr:hypothetical protein [Pontiellaceae bacterium B12227]
MNNWMISLVCLVSVNGCIAAEKAVLQEDFERFAPMIYADLEFSEYWKNVSWAHLYGKLAVVENGSQGKVLRISYPEGGVGPQETGSHFVLNLPPADEYELSYKVMFEQGFDFRLGGKLPGLTSGGEKYTGGIHPTKGEGWSARFMWREGGSAELYLYYVDNKSEWGDQHPFEGVVMQTGRWYEFRQRIRLNAPDGKDGRIQAWLDGKKVVDLKGLRLRIGELGEIDAFYFSTFHGGQTPEFAPMNDSFARFDDFLIKTR